MSNHTPGPWRFKKGEIYSSDDVLHSLCLINQNKANYHLNRILIASAPELLEALEMLIRAEEATIDGFEAEQIDNLERALHIAKVALAKAKGEEVSK